MTVKVLARDGLFIPIRFITDDIEERITARLHKDVYKSEDVCETCDFMPDRPSEVCDGCANFGGSFKLSRRVTLGDKEFMQIPYGDRHGLDEIFKGQTVRIINKCPEIPFKAPVKFTRTLKDYQKPITQILMEEQSGLLMSAPRTGKTVMGAHFICKVGLKTIILAAQKEWLDNFYETFVGGEKEPAFTDIKKSRIGFPKTLADFEKYDICLCTYQKFISEGGQKLLKKIRKMFSVLMVDEVHTANADCFAKVVTKFICKYKIGLTATVKRKDGREWVIDKLMGRVLAKTSVARMVPRIKLTYTKVSDPVPQMWVYMVRRIETNPERLLLIAKTCLKDIADGHTVLIPLTRIDAIRALAKAINRLAGKTVVAAFYGGVNKVKRKAILDYAREGKIKGIVGQTRLLSTGINIPRASCLYQCSPSANPPKAEQRFSRVLTPFEGKPEPVIRYFLDNVQVVKSCMVGEHFKVMIPKFRPKMSREVELALQEYFSKKKGSQPPRVGRAI